MKISEKNIAGSKGQKMLFNKYFYYKLLNKIKYYTMRPLKYAKSIGVKVGNNSKIMTKRFGTEPYLITIGENSEVTAGVNFGNS